MRLWGVLGFVLLLAAAWARADPPHTRLRMAAVAPDGTAWARELKAAAREVAAASNGEIELRWYLGAIAGDETDAIERIRRGQLDGTAGASFCERLAPSLRVLRIPGLIRDRAEGRYVISRLRPTFDAELARAGFVELFVAPFGNEVIFSRTPVASMSDLKTNRLWVWELAETLLGRLRQMGVHIVSLPLERAAHAYDEHLIDGFVGVPTAALAYQWIGRVRYYTPLNMALLPGCALLAQRAFDELSFDSRETLRAAIAKMGARFDEVGRLQDDELLGTLLEKQGLKRVPVTAAFRAEFMEEARRARRQGSAVPPALVDEVEGWLAEYRARH